MPIIDFHNHYYPPRYLRALQSGESAVQVTIDDRGNPLLHYPGDYNIAVPGQCNLEIREKMLNDHGIDMQVLSLTTPGTHVETPATAVRLAAIAVNDEFAEGIEDKAQAIHRARHIAFKRSRCIGEGTGARLPSTPSTWRDAVQQRERRAAG